MKTLLNLVACIALSLACQPLFAQGGQLAPGVDLNADGQAELLAANSGTVTVLDGATHAIIRTIAAPVANSGFGSAVCWLPDVNNDGFGDLAVLAPWTTTTTSWGTVYIYSLASGALLSTVDAPATRHFGVTLKLVADQDSDSIPDILVELQATGTQSKSLLISSRTGAILTELPGTVAEMLNYVNQGGKLYAQSDIDGSGTVDLLDVAGFTGLVTTEDPRADLNHDGVIDTDDTLVMIGDSSQGIVTIAAQNFVSGQQGGGPPENCLCTDAPANNTSPCDGVSVSVTFPSGIRVGEPFQLTVTGVPEGGNICAEIVQGNGLILNPSQSPISLVLFDSQNVCVRVKYTVMVGSEQCSKCTTVCMAPELICPPYAISLHCPTPADDCPMMVSANALNTVFALVAPEGWAVHWVIEDPAELVEWYLEYPTQLKFRTRNMAGTFTVKARYGPESGPCEAAYAECVITVDPDSDGDGLSDNWENSHHNAYPCLDPLNKDSDGDLVWDGAELAMGTDPCDDDSTPARTDSDRDGLTDIEEYQTYHTDPHLFDTDGDNVQDYAEVELARLNVMPGMDPLRAYSLADGNTSLPHAFDGWQASYYLAYDKDRDGLFDPWELAMGLDATQVDQDGDGIGDGLEMRPRPLPQFGWGEPTNVSPRSVFFAEDGVRGGQNSQDTDRDGLTDQQESWLGTNIRERDSDGDGINDGEEARSGLNALNVRSAGQSGTDGDDDLDGDGLLNRDENREGGDLSMRDTDGDGVDDAQEVLQNSMPNNANDQGEPLQSNEWVTLVIEADPHYYHGDRYELISIPMMEIGEAKIYPGETKTVHLPVGQLEIPCNFTGGLRRYHGDYFDDDYEFSIRFHVRDADGLAFVYSPVRYEGERGEPLLEGYSQYSGFGEYTYQELVVTPRVKIQDARHWGFDLESVSPDGPFEGGPPRLEFHLDPQIDIPDAEVDGTITDGASLLLLRLTPWPEGRYVNNLPVRLSRADPAISPDVGYIHDSLVYGNLEPIVRDIVSGRWGLTMSPTMPSCRQEEIFESGWDVEHAYGPGVFAYMPPERFVALEEAPGLGESFNLGSESETTIHLHIGGFQHRFYPQSPFHSSYYKAILVRRPPLLLIHGFTDRATRCWSALDSANLPIWSNEQFKTPVHRVDYGATSAGGFAENSVVLPPAIDFALGKFRSGEYGHKYAATRVNIAAHSMGGLVTKWYLADTTWALSQDPELLKRGWEWEGWADIDPSRSSDPASPKRLNVRADNYFFGDVCRFISIATPFDGSPTANVTAPLFEPTKDPMRIYAQVEMFKAKKKNPDLLYKTGSEAPSRMQTTQPTAFFDMQLDTGDMNSPCFEILRNSFYNWKFPESRLSEFRSDEPRYRNFMWGNIAWHPIAGIAAPIDYNGPGRIEYSDVCDALSDLGLRSQIHDYPGMYEEYEAIVSSVVGGSTMLRTNSDLVVPVLSAVSAMDPSAPFYMDPLISPNKSTIMRGLAHTRIAGIPGLCESTAVRDEVKRLMSAPLSEFWGNRELRK